MDAIFLFSVVCAMLYFQAGVYVLATYAYSSPGHWFSFSAMIFTIWMAIYAISATGPVAASMFPPELVTAGGALFVPSFIVQLVLSVRHKPPSLSTRLILFLVMIISGLLLLFVIIIPDMKPFRLPLSFLGNEANLYTLHTLFLAFHAYVFYLLQKRSADPVKSASNIIDKIPVFVVICDTSFRIFYANSYAISLFNRSESELNGRNLWNLILKGEEISAAKMHEVIRYSSARFECSLLSKEGHPIPVSAGLFMMSDVYMDVTGYALIAETSHEKEKLKNDLTQCEQNQSKIKKRIAESDRRIFEYSQKLADIRREHAGRIADLKNADEIMIAGIEERNLLIDEVHTRVASNSQLMKSLIDLYCSDLSDPAQRLRLEKLKLQVSVIMLAYRHLYFSLNYSHVDFKAFLLQMVSEMSGVFDPEGKVSISLNLDDSFVDLEHAIPLGLVLHELISNCYRHAFKMVKRGSGYGHDPNIGLNFHHHDKGFTFIVKDNGSGLDGAARLIATEKGGLALANMLVRQQIGGEIDIVVQGGTEVRIVFNES